VAFCGRKILSVVDPPFSVSPGRTKMPGKPQRKAPRAFLVHGQPAATVGEPVTLAAKYNLFFIQMLQAKFIHTDLEFGGKMGRNCGKTAVAMTDK